MEKVIYEQPLNERIRTFLRLELLFDQFHFHLKGESPFHSRCAVDQLHDIMNIFNRSELKSEVMKELDRHNLVLTRLDQSPGVDHDRLNKVLSKIEPLLDRLKNNSGPIGGALRRDDFLNTIRQRSSIPGGDCAFDLPQFHYWLNRPAAERQKQLTQWLSSFETVHQAVALILELVRESARPTQVVAEEGFYKRSLDPSVPCQMIRVGLPEGCKYFPEISAGKHRFSVRFLDTDNDSRPQQCKINVEFELTFCVI